MEKGVSLVLIALTIGIQALNIVTVTQVLKFTKYVDDLNGRSYNAYNAATQAYYYSFGFAISVAGITILIYLGLLIGKLMNSTISSKLQEFLYYVVALLQFSYAVYMAIVQSNYVDPKGPNGAAASTISLYVNAFNISLADTIIQWVICVPASFGLTLLNAPFVSAPTHSQTQMAKI